VDPVIRVAFVGAGKMARQHVHALRRVRTPHVVVGVCDAARGPARALATQVGAAPYTALSELLERERPDIVHVCTPAGRHAAVARAVLEAGAHVYVEKPFVEAEHEARELIALAASAGRRICAGHQQVRDPAYTRLIRRLPELGAVVQVDSDFAFNPANVNLRTAGPPALAAQLLDILPHPLSTLLDALERVRSEAGPLDVTTVVAEPTEVHAIVRANGCCGRLSVSLRARPVASTLAVMGTGGRLMADFIRTSVVGAANPGTGPLEKVADPLLEAWQMGAGAVVGVARRLTGGTQYPGLAELIGEFYAAVARGAAAPLSSNHLRDVTAVYEELAASIRAAAERAAVQRQALRVPPAAAPLAVVTGASGFFGREIARALALRGFLVRGVGRSREVSDPYIHEWRSCDLSRAAPAKLFAGAAVVVHAAAASSGGYEEHQHNTIDATRHVLRGMREADCARLVYVSSLSVLRPPRWPWERQDDGTPLARADARALGPYTWGKTEAERAVAGEASPLGIQTRVLRPAALFDDRQPEVPGLLGRRLFGGWHLGLGRPGLPFAACEVSRAAAVVAWCAGHFDDAPLAANLIDPAVMTRAALLRAFRAHGWRGRMLWMPLPLFAVLVTAARFGLALVRRRLPVRLSVWAIFRPRRFEASLGGRMLAIASGERLPARAPVPGERRVAS
jgi:predicted dehydrogenase/nucleoside-diphosphate-sugar epimerase